MRFWFLPHEPPYFDMFDELADTVTRASEMLLDMATKFNRLAERSYELRNEEHACDLIVGHIIEALDTSFVSPFDREDIHSLANRIDDVVDRIEETSHRFASFRVHIQTSESIVLALLIRDCCVQLAAALRLLRDLKDFEVIQTHVQTIDRLEDEAKLIYRKSDGELFANPPDVLLHIKWRELYSCLQRTVGACKDVAKIISEIVIKMA